MRKAILTRLIKLEIVSLPQKSAYHHTIYLITRFNLEKNNHTLLRFRTSFIIEFIVSSQRMITNFERQKRH